MSQTIGRTRLAYSRAWHHLSLSPLAPLWQKPIAAAAPTITSNPTDSTTPEPFENAIPPPPLGRLASRIALLLMGKHKPIYNPGTDCGDYVVITSCAQIRVTGNKLVQKKYYSHTTRPGSLKTVSLEKLMAKWGGSEILRRAVKGMLPKNKLQDRRLERLRCFEGEAHPYTENILRFAADEPTRRELREAMVEMGTLEPPEPTRKKAVRAVEVKKKKEVVKYPGGRRPKGWKEMPNLGGIVWERRDKPSVI